MTAAEIVLAGEYTRLDFQADLRVVLTAAREHGELVQRVRTWEDRNTIDLARRVWRMRESDHWRGPGMKGTDREFYGWLVAEAHVNSPGWARDLLMAGRVLPVLDGEEFARANFPVGASQVKALGSRWYRARPEAIVNVWLAAVEERGGQPGKELVAAKARRYKAARGEGEARRAGSKTADHKLAKLCDDILAIAADRPAATVEWLATVTAKVNKLVGII